MADHVLVDRLVALPDLADIPRSELEWLAEHGEIRFLAAGEVIAPKGRRIEYLWVVLSGFLAVHVDRGSGPRRVMEWRTGAVSGMLPYSRMKGPPGDNYAEEPTELLMVHERHFPDMIHQCPKLTAYSVHLMLDRARNFNASDLHAEKMISLGRLAAGLAHELNNPASATVRGAKLLLESLAEADAAARALGAAGLEPEVMKAIEAARTSCLADPGGLVLSPIEQADREDEIAGWLTRHHSDPAHVGALAGTAVNIDVLDRVAEAASGETLDAVLAWIATGCTTHSLAVDLERAATRIHHLVAAVKKFTYMDNLAGPESVEVEEGLRDTLRMLASKAKSKGATVALDVQEGLPRVCANGGDLNQVWLNLIDNALDAISEKGKIEINAREELDRVVVRVIDDGPGIPAEVIPQIFDPFFTTKPPGQGTGLGLEITRRLLHHHKGDIWVQSRPGRTEFRVRLVAESAAGTSEDAGTTRP